MVHTCTKARVLRHLDHEEELIIKSDASNYDFAEVSSKYDDERVLHPVAYSSKKHTPAQCNYDIYDKKLMGFIEAFEKWTPRCDGATYTLQLLNDHKNLEYFITKNLLNQNQIQ